MRSWPLVLSLTLLSGCTHDLAELRASAPKVMQEVAGPYDDLSKCAKQRLDNAKLTNLSLSEDPRAGVNRLAMLRDQDAIFEFAFVRQALTITLIEFRNTGLTDDSDIAWKAIAECSQNTLTELGGTLPQSVVSTTEHSANP